MGRADFVLTGQLKFVKDYENQYGGRISCLVQMESDRIKVPPHEVDVGRHGVFVGVKYTKKDLGKREFVTFRDSLQRDAYVFMTGDLKPKEATEKYPARVDLDTNWNRVRVADLPYPHMNRVCLEGEAVACNEQGGLLLQYSYMNPREKTWKYRAYQLFCPTYTGGFPRGTPLYVEGKVFGLRPDTGEKVLWLCGEVIV